MAMQWSGFSDEAITQMKLQSNKSDSTRQKFKEIDLSRNGRKKGTKDSFKRSAQNLKDMANAVVVDVCENKMSATKVRSEIECERTGAELPLNGTESSQNSVCSTTAESTDCSDGNTQPMNEMSDSKKSLTAKLVLPTLSEPTPSAINLSDFNAKHRLMEEQNRARKVFLAKALEDRKKQTHAEQLRLGMIQEELQKLDQRLSCDVSIIRNQIEAASLEFMEAQKRYDRAEKEFLDAKLLLYTKLERKELLTHHLCTIIEQNEMRKAQKLSELMEKLQMPDADMPQVQEGSSSNEPQRKISSEIILTPSSVTLQPDIPRVDSSKFSH